MDLLQRLALNARTSPDQAALIYVDGFCREKHRLSWADLARAVDQTRLFLADKLDPGETVFLVFEAEPRFAISFLACLSLEVVCLPLPAMDPGRAAAMCGDLVRLQADCGARYVLSAGMSLQCLADHLPKTPALLEIPLPVAMEQKPLPERPGNPEAPAGLLYTSGSTSLPKGVPIRQRHLDYNAASCCEAWQIAGDSVLVSWMPNQHSFGLIYNVLLPVYAGCTLVASSPAAFVGRPRLWFEMLHHYQGTHGAAATFGYQLCNDRLDPAELTDLDLTSWRVGLISAEPVRRGTCEGFIRRFAPLGVRPNLLCALYGLSESGPITSMPVDSPCHFLNKANTPHECDMACVGRPLPGSSVKIADPQTGLPLPAGEIGEVQLAGPSVMEGYFRRAEVNASAFVTRPEGRFFRTGDQGFLGERGLYLTGRIKEILIVRGKNYHPQDLEWAAKAGDPALTDATAAAFELENGLLVVVLENETAQAGVAERAAQAVNQHLGVSVQIVLTTPGIIPKTAGGKIRRAACRALFCEGRLPLLHVFQGERGTVTHAAEGGDLLEDLCMMVAAALALDPDELDEEAPLSAYQLDSMAVMELAGALQIRLGREVHPSVFFKAASLLELCQLLDPPHE